MSASVIIMDELASAPMTNNFPVTPCKRRIASNFSRAATTYDSSASLQQRVATKLRSHLPTFGSEYSLTMLDMGCGTGRETEALQRYYPKASITGLDLSEGMLAYARSHYLLKKGIWIQGDIEHMPFTDNTFDLVFSSLAIQWCESLGNVLAEAYRVLKPGGWFLFSTLAEGSLDELRRAWLSVDNQQHVNSYLSFKRQKSYIGQSEFCVGSLYQRTEVIYYPSVKSLLKDMKGLGANTVIDQKSTGLSKRSPLPQLRTGYSVFETVHGLPASYQVIYGSLKKTNKSFTKAT